jgi:hypothetical protein
VLPPGSRPGRADAPGRRAAVSSTSLSVPSVAVTREAQLVEPNVDLIEPLLGLRYLLPKDLQGEGDLLRACAAGRVLKLGRRRVEIDERPDDLNERVVLPAAEAAGEDVTARSLTSLPET